METDPLLHAIPDDELLARLFELLRQSRRSEADLVAHIGEVDARRLYLRRAASSMFVYCTEVLHLSEAEAFLRITVARASREHPVLLSMLAEGRLHLSGIAKLAPWLTPANRDEVLARASHRSKRAIEELVAELSPRPDVPDRIRRVPERHQLRPDGVDVSQAGAGARPTAPEAISPPDARPESPLAIATASGGACSADGGPSLIAPPLASERALAAAPATRSAGPSAPAPAEVACPARADVVEVTAPGRYKVQFTASAELAEKLERLQALMSSPGSLEGLAAVIDAAVSEKLQRLEARRHGRTERPRKTPVKTDARPGSRQIPAAVRRAVWQRDEGRCAFVDDRGRRCTERRRLEFHHRHPFGFGGDHAVDNVALTCRPHNQYLAEVDYGRGRMRSVRERPASSSPAPSSPAPSSPSPPSPSP